MTKMSKTSNRHPGLDLARAIAICLVLFWHLKPIKIAATSDTGPIGDFLCFALTQFYSQVTLIAVPAMLLVSLYLFYEKMDAAGFTYFPKRCRRITEVFVFWTLCQFALSYGIEALLTAVDKPLLYGPTMRPSLLRSLFEGGPPLPLVGPSVFYFLAVLLLLTLGAYIFYACRNVTGLTSIGGTAIIILALLYFWGATMWWQISIPYWRIDSFLIYIPIAYFIWKADRRTLKICVPLLCICFFLFSIQDFFLRELGHSVRIYSRSSVVCGSAALVGGLVLCERIAVSRTVAFLSTYSLGIFALHRYCRLLFLAIIPRLDEIKPIIIGGCQLNLQTLVVASAVIPLTFAAVALLKRTAFRRFVM